MKAILLKYLLLHYAAAKKTLSFYMTIYASSQPVWYSKTKMFLLVKWLHATAFNLTDSSSLSKFSNSTVVLNWESRWSDLWSKWLIFDLVFYNMKNLLYFGHLGSTLPLTEALKWGAVQTSTSISTGIMKGQS